MVFSSLLRLIVILVFLPYWLALDAQDKRAKTTPTTATAVRKDDSLLEIGRAEHLREVSQNPLELKIISYNIRWRGGDELQELIRLFREHEKIGGATILGLQEVDRNKKRTQAVNTVKLMADRLGLHYAWTAPPAAKVDDEEGTGVAILSPYPLSDIQRIVLPHEGPGRRRRVALGATISLKDITLRAYSVHAETRISVDRKLEQMKAILQDLARYPKNMPVAVVGDLNTWQGSAGSKTHKLFIGENFHTPFDDQATFSRKILFFPLNLKLDWIWLRNLEVLDSGIEKRITLSDHWPMWCIVKVKKP